MKNGNFTNEQALDYITDENFYYLVTRREDHKGAYFPTIKGEGEFIIVACGYDGNVLSLMGDDFNKSWGVYSAMIRRVGNQFACGNRLYNCLSDVLE